MSHRQLRFTNWMPYLFNAMFVYQTDSYGLLTGCQLNHPCMEAVLSCQPWTPSCGRVSTVGRGGPSSVNMVKDLQIL